MWLFRTFGVLMIVMDMNIGKLEKFFSYFELTTEEKYRYVRLKLDGEAYYWWKDNHRLCRSFFLLQSLLRAQYALHLHTVSESKFDVSPNPRATITDLFTEFQKILDRSF